MKIRIARSSQIYIVYTILDIVLPNVFYFVYNIYSHNCKCKLLLAFFSYIHIAHSGPERVNLKQIKKKNFSDEYWYSIFQFNSISLLTK